MRLVFLHLTLVLIRQPDINLKDRANFLVNSGLIRSYLPGLSESDLRERVTADHPAAREKKSLNPGFAADLKRFFKGDAVSFEFDGNMPASQGVKAIDLPVMVEAGHRLFMQHGLDDRRWRNDRLCQQKTERNGKTNRCT